MSPLKHLIAATMLAAIAMALSSCSGAEHPRLALLDGSSGDQRDSSPSPDSRWPDDMAFVGEFRELSVFAAVTADNSWCAYGAVPDLPDREGASLVSCISPEEFLNSGVRIDLETTGLTIHALVLPDNFHGEIDATWSRVNDNLVVDYGQ
ncbi:hypothetical protein [Salinibacterium sp. SWN167]|uniref:hypothetical protein n=1 Tax=Salinibacterium sp. SWN167 TaxID=2792054 RepID=UPI0018CE81B9|nr:hypothetical protein [Salinibacterium sp. SWN167]MBH0083884.1 hypothetical protein [Salinibacterium sp. SWN167]